MQRQRWFGSKSRELVRGRIVDAGVLRSSSPFFVCALFEAEFAEGPSELYQLLAGFRPTADEWERGVGFEVDGLTLYAALLDPALPRALVKPMRADEVVETTHGSIEFHATSELDEDVEDEDARAIGAEQSNSSVAFGERAFLKAYRRLEAGVSPELELLRFLSERGFENSPRLLGWYSYDGAPISTTLGILQAFVRGRSDGWDFALASLADGAEGFLGHLRRLGAVTGTMHAALASDSDDPGFRPEQLDAGRLTRLTAGIEAEVRDTFSALPPDAALDPVRDRADDVLERIRTLRSLGAYGRVIRQHGDYHLGQVLWTGDDWIVLDFEGEPARGLRGRRRKRSPFRDVAGMLRSFAYAAETSRQRGVAPPADWEERARAEFLAGYVAAVDPTLLPPSEEARAMLLTAFELEKAVYELRYELDNRPDWVRVPVAGIVSLLEARS